MAFTAEFYTINVPPNTLDKGEPGNDKIECNCTPFNSVSGLNGNILIDYNAAVEKCNYCKVTQDGGRTLYCYARNFSKDIGSRMTVELEIDPLMTNHTQILGCEGVLDVTTKSGDWDEWLVGDRMLHVFGINKGDDYDSAGLELDASAVFVATWG